MLQSAGQFCSKIYKGQKDLDAVDRTLYCLTAVDLKGKMLWPKFFASDGTPVDVFLWKDEYAQFKRLIRGERSYDCGVKYYVRAGPRPGSRWP
jgi:hypothetical protein